MDFNKTVLPHLRCIISEVKEQEQMREIRLPDGTPDIGRVLCTWGQIVIRGKEWRGNGITVSGGVQAKVLYEPDGGDRLQCLDSWIPFQTKWDFGCNEKDGVICVRPSLLGIDSRTASARKIVVCARIGIGVKAMVNDSLEIPTAVDLPDDIQLLKSTYCLQMPMEAGEKAFALEELIPFPEGKPEPSQLVSYCVEPMLSETKLMGDKLVFRGLVNLHIVYMDNGNRLHCWDHEMQFSQYTQLDSEFDDKADICIDFIITGSEVENAEGSSITCRIGLAAQYIIYNHTVTEVIEDVFSPVRKVLCTTDDIDIPSVLDRKQITLDAECQVPSDINDIIDVAFYPGTPRSYTENGEAYADLAGSFQILGYDMTGTAIAEKENWEKAFPMQSDIGSSSELRYLNNATLEKQLNGDTASLKAQLPVEIVTLNRSPITMVTGVDVGEPLEQNAERPSVIIRKGGGDSLWKIAKDSGSSVELIMKANGLEGEPDADQLILVPVT